MKSLHLTYQHSRAPEIYGDYWFNSPPLAIRELQGRPVLLFFCDYTSAQSQELIPLVNGLSALYEEYGLACIAIHSPEFFFGKDPKRVEQWIKDNLILFPVLTDNERPITNAYRISSIPAICLIDNKGDIYDTITESFIPERIERSVQYLLRQSGYRGELPILVNPAYDISYSLSSKVVKEIYTGYYHGALGNPEGYSPELAAEYADPRLFFRGKFYAHGIWRAERNAFSYEGGPNEGYVICQTEGDMVDAVIGSTVKTSVRVESDEAAVKLIHMGNDLKKDKQGYTYLTVEEPQLFSLLQKNNDEQHSLRLTPMSSGVTFYMFSFGAKLSDDQFDGKHNIRNN